MVTKPNAPSALRNQNAILEVISDEFLNVKVVLEIGSGTGQHAVFFASEMPWLNWQTSDLAANHGGINAWLEDANLENVKAPSVLDVTESLQSNDKYDAVFSANTAHIMIVGQCLIEGGKFCLYGPFNQNGDFSSDSNREFDANLKSQDSAMGIRDLEVLDGFAESNGLHRATLYAMPANNMIAIWTRN